MFRVSTTPIIRSTQNCNYSLRYWSATSLPTWPLGHVGGRLLHKKIWPVPEAIVTILCTPADGCGWHAKHVEWTRRIIDCFVLHLVGRLLIWISVTYLLISFVFDTPRQCRRYKFVSLKACNLVVTVLCAWSFMFHVGLCYCTIGSSPCFCTRCKQRFSSECKLLRMFWPKGHPRSMPVEAQRWGRGIALLILNLGARWRWAFDATPRLLYPGEITPLPIVNRGWVCPRAGLNGCGKEEISWTHRSSNPEAPLQ